MRVIQGPDLRSLHLQVIPHIVKNCYKDEHGNPIFFPGENNQETIECKELALFCKTPTEGRMFIHQPLLPFSEAFMHQYAHDLAFGKVGGGKFEYDYHGRLRCWGQEFLSVGIDQIVYIIEKLRRNESSRRAIGTTWYPHIDEGLEDVPCLQLIHCDIRDGKLNMKVVFRSEDMLLGLGPNMYGLVSLQNNIASNIGIPTGTYTHIAFCPHLYPKRDENELIYNEDKSRGFVEKWW